MCIALVLRAASRGAIRLKRTPVTLYDIPAPAKINLFLHVVGRRADGYHLLQTVFRFIDLQDTLHIEVRRDGQITRAYDLPGVSDNDDLCVRAARALQAATGCTQGAHIDLVKRIPAGGGLGGGSSDAASVMMALNRAWNTGLSREALMALALPLGADVPVFIFGQSAFAEGVGEKLTAVTLPERAYVIAQPDASVPTMSVFSDPDLTRDSPMIIIADFLARPTSDFGRNDLEPVVCKRFEPVSNALRALKQMGVAARMSGSGACLFAEYPTFATAVLAEQEIAATMRAASRGSATSPGRTSEKASTDDVYAAARFRLLQSCSGLDEHPLRYWIA